MSIDKKKAILNAPALTNALGHFSIDKVQARYSSLFTSQRNENLNNNKFGHDSGFITYTYFVGGNGTIALEEVYFFLGYSFEKPMRLISFSYEINIDNQYKLLFHYHPDFTDEKHAFVHIHALDEKGMERKYYFNPFKDFDLKSNILSGSNESTYDYIWNSNYNWVNYLSSMFKAHSLDSTVTLSDALEVLSIIFIKESSHDTLAKIIPFPNY